MTQPTNREPIIVPRLSLFNLNRVVATPGTLEACSREYMLDCLNLHSRGDWGTVCAEDWRANFEAMPTSLRIPSAYPIVPILHCEGYGDNCLWIITETGRSVLPPSCCRTYAYGIGRSPEFRL